VERVRALQACGFTPRQARFLMLVLEHSRGCLPRQYRAYAGIAHGRHSHRFFEKLIADGFATTDLSAPTRAGRIYRLQQKPWYRALGAPDHPHRRATSVGRAVDPSAAHRAGRLMVIDGVLAEPDVTWLGFGAGPPPPGAFAKTAPASGATQQPTSVTLSCEASAGATSYESCVDTTANGTCDSAWQPAGAATTRTVSGLSLLALLRRRGVGADGHAGGVLPPGRRGQRAGGDGCKRAGSAAA
jgi:hypothetical protein